MQKPTLRVFQANTKAKSADVNYNFEELSDYVFGSVAEMNSTINTKIANLTSTINTQIDELTESVNNFTEGFEDGTNFSDEGKEYLASLSAPSDRIKSYSVGRSGGTITAPADGYVIFYGEIANYAANSISLLNYGTASTLKDISNYSGYNDTDIKGAIVRCEKNDVIQYKYNGFSNLQLKFIYAKGVSEEDDE